MITSFILLVLHRFEWAHNEEGTNIEKGSDSNSNFQNVILIEFLKIRMQTN